MAVMDKKIERRYAGDGDRIFDKRRDYQHENRAIRPKGRKDAGGFRPIGLLLKPGLLILDEPTNHINFRHLPIIAEAPSNKYDGG